ncbi:MAG: L,D-transpeptidase family protein [Planctomycetales bacterium]|nr:L,D-transpeptidase family protein [Planctomycetales bacterium]
METIKTAVVVTCLLGVLYGVYTILNKSESTPPPEIAAAFAEGDPLSLEIDLGNTGVPEFADLPDAPGFEAPLDQTGYAAPMSGTTASGVADYPSPEQSLGATATEFANPYADATGNPYSDPNDAATLSAPPGADVPELSAIETGESGNSEPLNAIAPLNATVEAPPIDAASSLGLESPNLSELPTTTPPLNATAPDLGSDLGSLPGTQPPVDPEMSISPLGAAPSLSAGPGSTVVPGLPPVDENPATPGAPSVSSAEELRPFERGRRSAIAEIKAGQLRQALFTLSLFYGDNTLTLDEQKQLLDLLDPLAARVIYSKEHHLASAHVTAQGETVETIAAKYQIPPMLLININGILRPNLLTSGTELKVVPGPFRAEVDLERGEMTLFLQRMYAGRFPITAGNDPTPREGSYEVKEKSEGQTYYGAGGATIAAKDPSNPYGMHWIDLGGMSLHGSSQSPSAISSGCVSLSPRDAQDVYNILTIGSKVEVHR